MPESIKYENNLKETSWARTRLLALFLVFFATILILHFKEYQAAKKFYYNFEITKSREMAEPIVDALLEVVNGPGGGGDINPYIEALNRQGKFRARIVHSASITKEYGFEEGEEPQNELEKIALSNGEFLVGETEQKFIHTIPLKAREVCRPCHHEPEDLEQPVPLGYVLGLIQIEIPKTTYIESLASLKEQILKDVGLVSLMFIVFFAITFKLVSKIQSSEQKLRHINNSAKDAIIMMDAEGKVSQWNQAAERMFGYGEEQAVGKDLHGLIVPSRFHEEFHKGFGDFRKTGHGMVIGKTIELTGLKRDGTEFESEHSISAIKIDGKWQAIGIVRDITERKQAEEALHESNAKLKITLSELQKAQSVLVRSEKLASIGTLSAGVAHEILNPLNIISTTTQVLKMEELPGEVLENLDEIMRQVERATTITNNLRMFAHQKKAEITPVDISALFDSVASLMEHDMSLDNITISREFHKDLPIIEADEGKLEQVFINLLNNAKDAMKDGQGNAITIGAKPLEEEVEIRFSDNGPGIPPNIAEKIFDPFFSTKDPGQGTGLGLSIVHSIIEDHGGSIRMESKEGKGTMFVIRLPTGHSKQ